ncbi:hypothetical protein IQ238_19770 [Pleurocapsales cyanobacterium LEGE 06147]|nr:hypothetical protein [Pleurocapsales cyanobacterium LEGE 06147]
MRLLTTACCTLTFVSIPGLTAWANSADGAYEPQGVHKSWRKPPGTTPYDQTLQLSESEATLTATESATQAWSEPSLQAFSSSGSKSQISVSMQKPVVAINQNALIEHKSDLIEQYQQTANAASLSKSCIQANQQLAQSQPTSEQPKIEETLSELEKIKEEQPDIGNRGSSPGVTIVNPYGFGADGNTFFFSPSFQSALRFNQSDVDFGMGFGLGLGDSRQAVGVELGYAMSAFGRDRDWGSGGFNFKVHRQLQEGLALAFGWNGLLNIGSDNDFEDSVYGAFTKIFRTRENINSPFSRVAVSAGLGSGQFLEDGDGVAVFGGMAVRVAQPLSFITEWTGQDLAIGLSIAPFKNIPINFTPAIRDIAGAGDGARFILGAGVGFSF